MPKNITLKKKRKIKLILVESFPEKLNIKVSSEILSMDKKPMHYNDAFIEILGQLKDILSRQGEPFRARAYQKAQETIMMFPDNITDPMQLKGKPGIGDTIMLKLQEYVKTGKLAVLEKEKNNPINIFTRIYGVGPKKAQELVKSGITTISELRNNPDVLNDIQRTGLKHYDDICKRIPRSEIDDFYIKLGTIFEELTPCGARFDIVGSYRRGVSDSGDIDVIITNDQNNSDVFNIVMDWLINDGTIVEILSRGKVKSLVIANIYPEKDKNIPMRRVDFLYAPPSEYPFAVLYFTGSKTFNTLMRQKALELGYTLNEHGLSYMKNGTKGAKVEQEFPDEKSIFDFLGMEYKKPEERIDGRSIKEKTAASLIPLNPHPTASGIAKNKTLKKVKLLSTTEYIDKFKNDGIGALKLMTEPELAQIIRDANNSYYCDEDPIITDALYDILIEYVSEKYPDNSVIKEGHTKCHITVEKSKVKLPYGLWSMDKIKPDIGSVSKWEKKYPGPYVISCKLDGISALYVSGTKTGEAKLYTRGNGTYGQDITHLIPSIIWKNKGMKDFEIEFAIRGEIIIKKSVFDKKYADKFANPRNFVAGLVNKKTINDDILSDLDFVPYEVIKPILKSSDQMKFIKNEWVSSPVKYSIVSEISNEILSDKLLLWREGYPYEIDGIIVVNDKIYPRPEKNPEYAFAFKMVVSEQVAESTVVDVIWTPSKDGYLKPRIRIKPVVLGGAKIEYATGKNAKFIKDHKLGIGAIVKIVRSGDVIPDIKKGDVIVPAEKAKMPDVPFEWNETGVDIMLIDKDDNSVVREKNIAGFFKGLDVTGLGPGNVKKIIEAGYDSVPAIIAMKYDDFLKVDGFKDKLATKILNEIKDKVDKAGLVKLMAASNIFGRGFGERRSGAILKIYPDILVSDLDNKEKIKIVVKIDGFASKTAEKFVEKIPEFVTFMNDAGLEHILYSVKPHNEATDIGGHLLQGKKIVMTGFRDKELMELIKAVGGDNSSAVTKNTFVVIVKDKDDDTGKAGQARKLNIPLMLVEEFILKYIK